MMVGTDDAASARAAFRAFVRAHHPDVGGDPEVFAAGLAEFRAADAAARQAQRPRDRYDAPVVVVHRSRGPRAVLRRIHRWRARRNRRARLR